MTQTQNFTSDDELVKEAEQRLKAACKDRDQHKARLEDYNKYVLPWRSQKDGNWNGSYVDDVFDNTATDGAMDFAADMLATFTPDHADWIDPVPSIELNQADQAQIKAEIAAFKDSVFYDIRRSNFRSEALECYLDLSGGTCAIIIQDVDKAEPFVCESIPVKDLLIGRGPRKTIGIKAYDLLGIAADQIPFMWPEAKDNKELMREIKDAPAAQWTIRQTMWRDYDRRDTEVWKYVAYSGKHKIASGSYEGEGSCPMIVARWLTDNTTAWGIGAGFIKLPDIKTANFLGEMLLEAVEYGLDPATTYDDDGTISLDQGIRPGTHIPKQPGSEIKVLESGSRLDVGYFERDGLQTNIKRGFYQDKPDQAGKTPPTASQWLDEASRAARRMGAPAGRLIDEWQIPVFKRFAYLKAQRGTLPDVKLNGKVIGLNPTSPLIRSLKLEQAQRKMQFVQSLNGALGPQLSPLVINQVEFAYTLADDMGMDPRLLRDKKMIQQIVDQGVGGILQQAMTTGDTGLGAQNGME